MIAAAAVDPTPSLISAAGALLGVIIGGVLSAGVENYRQRRRDARLRGAALRLLREEFSEGAVVFQRVVTSGVASRELFPQIAPSWDQYREFLAGNMPKDDDFDELSITISESRRKRWEILGSFPPGDSVSMPLPPAYCEAAQQERDQLSVAAGRVRAI